MNYTDYRFIYLLGLEILMYKHDYSLADDRSCCCQRMIDNQVLAGLWSPVLLKL